MTQSKALWVILITSLLLGCTDPKQEAKTHSTLPETEPTNKVVLSSQINWEALNPARGDQSPMAGTIWGDRKGEVATGFLAKFVDGFSSPPHIHNVTYRAVVLKGLIHNDDPLAEKMWMPAGSFWTQPAGEPHITAAKGVENIAYVEIDRGPYLVKPIEEAFDTGERPVNIDKSNIVWLNATQTSLIEQGEGQNSVNRANIAFLWENDHTTGYFVKLLPGFKGSIQSDGKEFHAVIILGEVSYEMPQTEESSLLDPGSYFTSEGPSTHKLSAQGEKEGLVYIRTNGDLRVKP